MYVTSEYVLNTPQLNELLGNVINEQNVPEDQSTVYVRGLGATKYDTV